MKITIWEYEVTTAAEMLGCSEADVFEWYGEDTVNVYIAERSDGEWGAMTGVRKADGSYAVYGLRRDEENITYKQMVAVLSTVF